MARKSRWTVLLVIPGAMLPLACGGDAESADVDQSSVAVREAAPAPPSPELVPAAEPAEEPVEEQPAVEPAATPSPAPPDETRPRPPVRARPEPEPTMPPAPEEPVVSVVPEGDRRSEDATAPSAEAAPAPPPVVRSVAAGRSVSLTLSQRLSTGDSRTGDVFWATLSDDVLAADGEVLLPVGARVEGRILESRESARSGERAVLRLGVERVELGNALVLLAASLVEVDMSAETRDSDTETAIKVGAGAVAGALLGRILGRDAEDALKGAVVGAAAGTAFALSSRDGHATVEQGARLVIQLDEALILPN